jgi:deazaflavin-dependent oxidoreductase (nitroreductase family)
MNDTYDMPSYNNALIAGFRANGGKLSGRLANSHILLFTATGAKSGIERIAPLGYGKHGDTYVVVAANAGASRHPEWYYNLLANPDVTVEAGEKRFAARATTVEGAERDRLLANAASIVPWFAAQQEKTSRKIPFVVLKRSENSNNG